MNLQELQELRNSITEIRNDENYKQGLKLIKNLIGSTNLEHQSITIQLAIDSFKKFEDEFDQKISKIDSFLLQLEEMLK